MKNRKFLLKLGLKISFIGVVILIAITAINFAMKQIKQINLTMLEKKEMNYLIKNQTEINTKIQNDFANIDPNYEKRINDSLPSIYNILPFVTVMENLATKNSLQQTINFSPPSTILETAGPLNVASVNFSVSLSNVTVDNFISYLKDFEKLPYFASINSISLNSVGANGWLDYSAIILSGKLYVRQ